MELEAAKMIGAGLAAIALAGAGVGIGIIFGNYLSGAMRNPSAAQKQFPNLLLGFALAEATGLFGLVVALIILLYSFIFSSLSLRWLSAASIFSKIWDFLISRLLLIFGSISLESTIYKIPKVSVNQKICEIQNSGFNWGIPPLSAAKASKEKRKLKNIDWKYIFLIIKFKMQIEWLTQLPIQIILLPLQEQSPKVNLETVFVQPMDFLIAPDK